MTLDPAPVDGSVPGLTVAAVARRLGVAPATLRTWDRRYGIGPSGHTAGAHRRYTPADVARLERMRRLVIEGCPPAEAARAACGSADEPAPVSWLPGASPPVPLEPARAGGGRVVALPGASARTRGLARAAQSLDAASCTAIISESLAARGVIWTWDRLVLPALVGIGRQWQSGGHGVDVEHALSGAVQDALSGAVRAMPPPTNTRAVLLAGSPGELHSLPLWAVAAALAERRIGARILGASLPTGALAEAVQRLGPAVVFVWAQLPGAADLRLPAELPALRPAATILVGGPGWPSELPAGATRVVDLADAVAGIAHALGE